MCTALVYYLAACEGGFHLMCTLADVMTAPSGAPESAIHQEQ